jgi:hypothetical protein
MSEENKTLLRRCVDEVWYKRNLDASGELRPPDFLDHADKEVRGPAEGVSRFHQAYPEASPHADVTVEKKRLPLP